MKLRRVLFLSCCFLLIAATVAPAQSDANGSAKLPTRNGQHDFDFEFGNWKIHLKRRLRPLTGSNSWVEYDGTSIVRKVWDGQANLGELNVDGPAGHIRGLSLRLYNPQSGQWNISWSNSADGAIGPPMIGEFRNGRGEFFNQETLNGRAIFVRFIFSDITETSFSLEQAFSADGGKTWEANWIAAFKREPQKVSEARP